MPIQHRLACRAPLPAGLTGTKFGDVFPMKNTANINVAYFRIVILQEQIAWVDKNLSLFYQRSIKELTMEYFI
jgi:hypothetical protein